jgi:hypothetical protein
MKEVRLAGHVAGFGVPEAKWPSRRRRRILEDNIKMTLKVTGYWGVNWFNLDEDTHRGVLM